MIDRNVKYGKTEAVTIAIFGDGTAISVIGESEDSVDVVFATGGPGEPGTEEKLNSKEMEDFKPELVLRFKNLAGFRSMMKTMEDVRQILEEQEK